MILDAKQNENLSASDLKQIKLGEGTANILLKPSETIFYKVLSENCDVDIESESDLIALVKDLNIDSYKNIDELLEKVDFEGKDVCILPYGGSVVPLLQK